jgi:hypothetical protein
MARRSRLSSFNVLVHASNAARWVGRVDAPETTLERTQAIAGTLLLAIYVYGRLRFTDLGEEVRAFVDEDVLNR